MNTLFELPETPSPRMQWMAQMKERGALTHYSDLPDESPWMAIFPFDDEKDKSSLANCMAENCRLYDEQGLIALGDTEIDALTALAVIHKIKLWNE